MKEQVRLWLALVAIMIVATGVRAECWLCQPIFGGGEECTVVPSGTPGSGASCSVVPGIGTCAIGGDECLSPADCPSGTACLNATFCLVTGDCTGGGGPSDPPEPDPECPPGQRCIVNIQQT